MKRRVKEAAGDKSAFNKLRREALCWKANLEATGRNADALDANHAAIEVNRDHVLAKWRPKWLAAWAFELPTNYGTDPYQLLLITLIVIALCAIIYAAADPFVEVETGKGRPKAPLLLFGLLFSIETFVPVLQVTGIKDWGWEIKTSGWRWLEALEGLAGGIRTRGRLQHCVVRLLSVLALHAHIDHEGDRRACQSGAGEAGQHHT